MDRDPFDTAALAFLLALSASAGVMIVAVIGGGW